jgi:opacity protein-like surface antigen
MRLGALLAASAALVAAEPARATGYLDDWHPYQTYWAVGWTTAVPLAGMRTGFIENPGWLGGGFDIQIGVAGRLAVGVNGTWNWFDQTFSNLTIQRSSFTFTGPVYRRLSAFTALGTARYYLTQGAVQPWVGAGIGGTWFSSVEQVVNLSRSDYNSGFAITGEAGVLFTVAERLGLSLGARYQYNLTTLPGAGSAQWVSALAGVAYYF